MKKAYVKPVFLAEEFVAAASYAANGCDTTRISPKYIEQGMQICRDDPGHTVGGNKTAEIQGYYDNNTTYWQYASWSEDVRGGAGDSQHAAENAYLFSSEFSVCDFVWNNTANEVGVWREQTNEETGKLEWAVSWIKDALFATFFLGTGSTIKNHTPYLEEVLPS